MIETITSLINHELLNPSWEMTKQLLACMEVKLDNGLPKIQSIVIKQDIGKAEAYIAVKNEPFYIKVSFDIEDQITIQWVDTEPYIRMSYGPTSEDIGTAELLQMTTLVPNEVITPGTKSSNEKFQYNYNGLSFDSPDEPGKFEDKLDAFLAYLEQDVAGVKALSKATGAEDIFVTICYYIGNRIFTGLYLTNNQISRLNSLGLTLTFDIYTLGKPPK